MHTQNVYHTYIHYSPTQPRGTPAAGSNNKAASAVGRKLQQLVVIAQGDDGN